MSSKKWPEDGYSEGPVVLFEDKERLSTDEKLQVAFQQEADRIGRFDKYRRVAGQYLDLAREAKIDADQALTILMKILQDLPFPKLVLQVESVINTARPIVQRTIVMLGNNIQLDADANPEYIEQNLSTTHIASRLAYDDLSKAMRGTDLESRSTDEKQMELPAITDRQKRIGTERNIPPNVREREITRLTEDLQKNLLAFAAGNAFLTLHDIDGLMRTLDISKTFFEQELKDWRKVLKDIEVMKLFEMPDSEIKRALEAYDINSRTQVFHEMYIRLDSSLKIAEARMEFVNQKDNGILAQEYDKPTLIRLLREVISGTLENVREESFLGKLLSRVRRKAPKPIADSKGQKNYERVLRQALKNREG